MSSSNSTSLPLLPSFPREEVLRMHGITERECAFIENLALRPSGEDNLLFGVSQRLQVPDAEKEELRAQLRGCLKKQWIQVVSRDEMARIRRFVNGVEFVGDEYRFPLLGQLDLTLLGAAIYRSLGNIFARNVPPFPTRHGRVTFQEEEIVFLKEEDASRFIALVAEGEWMPGWRVEATRKIQEWRGRWWERWRSGVVVTLVWSESPNRTQAVEKDIVAPLESPIISRSERVPSNFQLTFPAAAQTLGYTYLHWLVLLTVAIGGHFSPRKPSNLAVVAQRLARRSGMTIPSVDDLLQALADCIDHGFVRAITQEQIRQMRQEMQHAPPLRGYPRANYYTFTDEGAELFVSWHQLLFGENRELEMWKMGFFDLTLGPGVQATMSESARIVVYSNERAELSQLLLGMSGELMGVENWKVVSETDWESVGPWFMHWWSPHPSGFKKVAELRAKRP